MYSETYVCRSMDTECKLATVAFRPGCIKFSVEEISDISASTCKMEFKLPPHLSSSEKFDASLNTVLNHYLILCTGVLCSISHHHGLFIYSLTLLT